MQANEKSEEIIAGYHNAVIAFSGGVDSTFLAAVAKTVLPVLRPVSHTAKQLLLITEERSENE